MAIYEQDIMILLKLANHARCLDQVGRHAEADSVLRMMIGASNTRTASAYDSPDFENELVYSFTNPQGYKFLTEKVKVFGDDSCPPVVLQSVYNSDDDYIGSVEDAQRILAKGIKPEIASPDDKVCSIGFSEKLKKYFGWSHRAIQGFGVGDKTRRMFSEDEEKTIQSLDEAKQAAIEFAEDVSQNLLT